MHETYILCMQMYILIKKHGFCYLVIIIST